MELVIPPLFGALFMQFLGKPYLFKGLFRVFTRFMMVRGLLSPGHPLYSFLNSAAYILPCCIGITGKDLIGKWWKNESINSENITTNLLLDTASSMIIYDALPKGVDRLIPSVNAA